MPNLRQILIGQLEDSRRNLIALVNQAPTDGYIYPNWTLKQYIDHISGWDDAMVEALEAHARNEPVPQSAARGIDAYNAQTVSTRATLDLAHSRREFAASHERVLQTLRNLPDEKFDQLLVFPWGETGTVKDFIEIFVTHDEEHVHHLAAWLKNPHQVIGEHEPDD
ncbi:MAG TPA: DinB family protein [Anaerolineales bacterium]|nr:DinB family protein [Anaerolineales bacterium]